MSVYICDVCNNLIWALIVWAVALINKDSIGNIVHDNILEMHIRSTQGGQEGHVLILTPFFVLLRVPPITLIPETGCSF